LNDVWQKISTKLYSQTEPEVTEMSPEEFKSSMSEPGTETVDFEEVK
jgi:hypothetical protein